MVYLRWEICKVQADAEKEFDRTIDYINNTIKAYKVGCGRQTRQILCDFGTPLPFKSSHDCVALGKRIACVSAVV